MPAVTECLACSTLRKRAFLPIGLLIGMRPADMGNAAKTLACLLEKEPLDSQMQRELLQSMHFAASRAFLLLRMTANALLVHMEQPMNLGCNLCLLSFTTIVRLLAGIDSS